MNGCPNVNYLVAHLEAWVLVIWWAVWKAENESTHKCITINPAKILNNAKVLMIRPSWPSEIHCWKNKKSMDPGYSLRNKDDMVHVYTDVAFRITDKKKTSFGFILQLKGTSFGAGACQGTCAYSAEAVARSILLILKRIQFLGLLKVQIFLDALEVIQAINGAEDWSTKAICQYISCVSSHFDSILFFFFTFLEI